MKTAVLTGASSGLGYQIALEVAKRYDNVILISRNSDKLRNIGQKCLALSAKKVICLSCDLSKTSQIITTTNWIKSHFENIDLLINNAGMAFFKFFKEQNIAEINQCLSLNLQGLITFTRLLLPLMINNRSNTDIINIGSMAGKVSTAKTTIYAASKAGVIAFSNALRLELKADNIRVHTVNLGPMDTNFFATADPKGKYAKSVKNIMLNPKTVAQKTILLVGSTKRELNLPRLMDFGGKVYNCFPTIGDLILNNPMVNRK